RDLATRGASHRGPHRRGLHPEQRRGRGGRAGSRPAWSHDGRPRRRLTRAFFEPGVGSPPLPPGMRDARSPAFREAAWLSGYAGLYAATLALLHVREGFDIGEPLLVLGLIGIGFS